MRCGIVGALTVAAVMSVSGAAIAATNAMMMDGNQLYAMCTSQNFVPQAQCESYIVGVSDTAGISDLRIVGVSTAGVVGLFGVRICAAYGTTAEQLVDVVKQYLAGHPEARNYNAAGIVAIALEKAWPCAGSH